MKKLKENISMNLNPVKKKMIICKQIERNSKVKIN